MSDSEAPGKAAFGGGQKGHRRHYPLVGSTGEEGLTLIEVLIALGIVSIGLLAVAGLQATAIGGNRDARMRTEATALAVDTLEQLRLLHFDHPDLAADPAPHGRSPGGGSTYTVQWAVVDDRPAAGTKTVWVEVGWQGVGGSRTVRLRTVLADPSP